MNDDQTTSIYVIPATLDDILDATEKFRAYRDTLVDTLIESKYSLKKCREQAYHMSLAKLNRAIELSAMARSDIHEILGLMYAHRCVCMALNETGCVDKVKFDSTMHTMTYLENEFSKLTDELIRYEKHACEVASKRYLRRAHAFRALAKLFIVLAILFTISGLVNLIALLGS